MEGRMEEREASLAGQSPMEAREGGQPQSGERKRKKPYQRHPKPPYSYLALIALVIQRDPHKRLRLAQILTEIQRLFPLFTEGYQGWKDSVRHNLSSNQCFLREETNNGKGKRNFWRVDVGQIPPGLLKRQNTRALRLGGAPFVPDLAPFILHGEPYPPPSLGRDALKEGPALGSPRSRRETPKKGSSFRIVELVPEVAREATLEKDGGSSPGCGQPPSLFPTFYPTASSLPAPSSCFQPPSMSWGHPLTFYGDDLTPFALPKPCCAIGPSPSGMYTPMACFSPMRSPVPAPLSSAFYPGHPLGSPPTLVPPPWCPPYPPWPGWSPL